MVQPSRNEQTLFLVGGQNPDSKALSSKTFQSVCDKAPESCKWEKFKVGMKHARRGHAVLSIGESLAMELCNK